MTSTSWLADTRASYDTVAADYVDLVRRYAPLDEPYLQLALTRFAAGVRTAGDGPAVDIGCGPGDVTAELARRGLDVHGIDLSPGMIEQARRLHPDLTFAVGSMTELDLPDSAHDGLVAWWSIIHVPDDDLPGVFAEFHRVLRPGGLVLLGFHVGDTARLKTDGYGGHPMHVYVHRRQPSAVAAALGAAGFAVEAVLTLDPHGEVPGGLVFARRRPSVDPIGGRTPKGQARSASSSTRASGTPGR